MPLPFYMWYNAWCIATITLFHGRRWQKNDGSTNRLLIIPNKIPQSIDYFKIDTSRQFLLCHTTGANMFELCKDHHQDWMTLVKKLKSSKGILVLNSAAAGISNRKLNILTTKPSNPSHVKLTFETNFSHAVSKVFCCKCDRRVTRWTANLQYKVDGWVVLWRLRNVDEKVRPSTDRVQAHDVRHVGQQARLCNNIDRKIHQQLLDLIELAYDPCWPILVFNWPIQNAGVDNTSVPKNIASTHCRQMTSQWKTRERGTTSYSAKRWPIISKYTLQNAILI